MTDTKTTFEPEKEDVLRIVLVGQERVGKSSAGNTILGKKEFECPVSSIPVTLKSKKAEGEVLDHKVSVVDTPGLCSSQLTADEIKKELQVALTLSSPGPHIFLLVLQLGRFTKQEQRLLKTLESILSSDVSKHTMILFTYGDRLKDSGINMDQFLKDDEYLQNLLQDSCGTYHVFNNNDMEDKRQVKELIEKIDSISNRGEQIYKEKEPQSGWLGWADSIRYYIDRIYTMIFSED